MSFDEVLRIVTLLVLGGSLVINFQNFNFLRMHNFGARLYSSISDFNLHRSELETVLALDGVPFEKWTPEQKEAANVICFDFFHLGHLILHEHISKDFCELYYYSIPKVREICDPYIRDIRENRHSQYWRKFDDLVRVYMEYTKTHAGGVYYIDCAADLLPEVNN